MNFSKIKKYSWMLAAVSVVFSSCSKEALDNVNVNTNDPTNVQGKFILADVLTRTAVNNSGGDINTYLTTYVEHEVGVYGQMYQSEIRESQPTSASTFNNSWGSIYTTLKNAKDIIARCSPGGSEPANFVTKGMAEVMAAYNLALLTDMYGDAPWTEAGDIKVSLTPKIDKQQAIYADVMKYLDAAIIDLGKTDAQGVGSYDLLYGGSTTKWIKFAHGLKARYTMHLLKRATNANASLQTVIDEVNASFASAADQAAFNVYDASNLNPYFDYQWSRDGLAASRSLVDKFIERNDPRLGRSFVDPDWVQLSPITTGSAVYNLMAPNGTPVQQQYVYNTSIFVFSQTAPTMLLSYHEILFLKAEAMARLGQNAVTVTKAAVVAAIANTEVSVTAALNAPSPGAYGGLTETTSAITPAQAATYFDTQVVPLLLANPLKEIANQKYLAFFGSSGETTETYNDIRRYKGLGENLITLASPKPFPLRLTYGNDDTTTNPNVQAAYGDGQYVYTEPVWWAGGTR
ncbi:SusD/RagB family nutrient-binding outer membrane lipoprotein [Mucilaginibacter puniceus]